MKNQITENSSLKEQRKVQLFKTGDMNVPLYSDDKFNKEIKLVEEKREIEEQIEKHKEQRYLNLKEKEEYKKNLIPFMNINGYLLSVCSISLILGITSISQLNIKCFIYSIFSIFVTIWVGRRLTFNKDKYDNLFNVLLWNITQSLSDFIEYKISYDLKSNYVKFIKKCSICASISLLFLNSNNIFFGLSLILLLIGYLVSFAYRDFDSILNTLNKLIMFALIGLFLKTFLSFFICDFFIIDFSNILVINILTVISLIKYLKLEEPID